MMEMPLAIPDEEMKIPCPVAPMTSKSSGGSCPFIASSHTDPSLDFFEVGYPIKYKKRFSHYFNQRVIYSVAAEQDEAPPNIIEETKVEE